MTIKHTLSICLICTLICTNAYAQKLKTPKVPKVKSSAVKAASVTENTAAYQAALKQVQILQKMKSSAAGLPSSLPVKKPALVDLDAKTLQKRYTTSKERLAQLEEFIAQNKRFPLDSRHNEEEGKLYAAFYTTLKNAKPGDPVARRMRQLREQYPNPVIKTSPQERLTQLEEFVAQNGRFPSQASMDKQESSLYAAIYSALVRIAKDSPIALRMRELREQYPPAARGVSYEQRLAQLEEFIAQNGRFPSQASMDKQETALYMAFSNARRLLEPNHPVLRRMLELRQQYAFRRGNSPQEWLSELEKFVAQNGRYPSSKIAEEKALYIGIHNLLSAQRADPRIEARLREIRQEYVPTSPAQPKNPPTYWLDELEKFVEQNGRFPTASKDSKEEARLYTKIYEICRKYQADDPIVLRVRQLQEQYPLRRGRHGKSPQEWLAQLEEFVAQNGRYPSQAFVDNKEEVSLYQAVATMPYRLDANDPIVLRIKELRKQYPPKK